MTDISKPFYDIEQEDKVLLKPEQMNSDILLNLKINLREKVEKKCNINGYVDQIYKILKYGDGLMTAENLSGSAIYPVRYHCRIYVPLENSKIIGEVTVINPELIVAINGPIRFFIMREKVNTNNFDINNGFRLKNAKGDKKTLNLNDKVIINVEDKRINYGDKTIKCMGYMEDIATESQIKKYYLSESDDNTPNNYII